MTAPAGEMGDDEILGLADALIAIHLQVVRNKGLDLSEIASPEKEEMVRGRIISVIRPCFGCVFGQSPAERYGDIFDQISVFAQHFAKDHIFADGNKRTTVIACLALLERFDFAVEVVDSGDPAENEMYGAIQRLVTGKVDAKNFAAFLRERAFPGMGTHLL